MKSANNLSNHSDHIQDSWVAFMPLLCEFMDPEVDIWTSINSEYKGDFNLCEIVSLPTIDKQQSTNMKNVVSEGAGTKHHTRLWLSLIAFIPTLLYSGNHTTNLTVEVNSPLTADVVFTGPCWRIVV
jgi:hypothetical protein